MSDHRNRVDGVGVKVAPHALPEANAAIGLRGENGEDVAAPADGEELEPAEGVPGARRVTQRASVSAW